MMSLKRKLFFLTCFLVITSPLFADIRHFPLTKQHVVMTKTPGIRSDVLKNIAPIIEKSIQQGQYAGAVILAAHHGKIIYQGIFGHRRIAPDMTTMQANTLFDIASLTKVVATTPAIMQLIEKGQIGLDDPVIKYWGEFAQFNKEKITIRELLTHTSGLAANLPKKNVDVLTQIIQLHPEHSPGTTYLYSDINFIILGHLIEKISGERLDHYVEKNILQPLNMRDTFFLPSATLKNRIAPTEIVDNALRWGKVHDPIAYQMGGIAGHAGLFSTAQDLGKYAQCLLDHGKMKNGKKYLLGPITIKKMTSPQTPENIVEKRGLGWDIDSPFTARGVLASTASFGHTGWTGTSLWIDPATATWLVVLTSRTHPTPADKNHLTEDRRLIQNIIAASLIDVNSIQNTSAGELHRAYM